jgi:hypothetical protein
MRDADSIATLIFGRLDFEAIPLHEPILLYTFIAVVSWMPCWARSPICGSGGAYGWSGSPASTTNALASCTWCSDG